MRTSGWTSPRVCQMLCGRIAPARFHLGSAPADRHEIEECRVQANPGVPDAEMVVGSPPRDAGRACPPPLSEAALREPMFAERAAGATLLRSRINWPRSGS
jgi:hypothetical protein